jgi:hypothetical protein
LIKSVASVDLGALALHQRPDRDVEQRFGPRIILPDCDLHGAEADLPLERLRRETDRERGKERRSQGGESVTRHGYLPGPEAHKMARLGTGGQSARA